MLDAAIFFDFRAVVGELSLTALEEIVASAKTEKLFIAHMTKDALVFSPPLGFFNRIRSDNGMVDIKKGRDHAHRRLGPRGRVGQRITRALDFGKIGYGRANPEIFSARMTLRSSQRSFSFCCIFACASSWRRCAPTVRSITTFI